MKITHSLALAALLFAALPASAQIIINVDNSTSANLQSIEIDGTTYTSFIDGSITAISVKGTSSALQITGGSSPLTGTTLTNTVFDDASLMTGFASMNAFTYTFDSSVVAGVATLVIPEESE